MGQAAPHASNHDARAQSWDGFTFGSGPVNRFAAEAGPPGVRAESVWPGGTSGVLSSPFYFNLLPLWLTNDTIPLLYRVNDLVGNVWSVRKFVPAKGKK
ncbi:MAG: penicillin acylase family protein [Vicinamibacterales bacterium]|nr:penicillin acylase family protein [Vicinamibacterales bacterium]